MENKQNKTITLRLNESLYNKILQRADEENRNLSSFVKHCILKYIERLEEVEKMRG